MNSGPDAHAKQIRRSVMAFLEGEQDLEWIAGAILRTGDLETVRLFMRDLAGYGDAARYEQLVRWIEAQR